MSPAAFTVVCGTADRAAWLEARKSGVGSSESPALVLGKHFGRTPMALFLDKVGMREADDGEHEGLTLGTELEPFVRERWMRETGRYCEPSGRLVRSVRWPFMLASPDAHELDEAGMLVGPVELKTAGSLGDWTDGVPEKYRIQCQHQMAVTGEPTCSIAVLAGGFGGLAFRWADIARDDSFIEEELVPACERFWRCVEARTPPGVDGTEATARALAKLYATPTEETVALGGDMIDLFDRHAAIVETCKAAEQEKHEIENTIKARLGNASVGVLPNGNCWTWKAQTRTDPPREAKTHTFRVLRRKEAKR